MTTRSYYHRNIAGFCAFLVAIASLTVHAEQAFVIDRLLVGIYAEPNLDSERLDLYPTATVMEILEQQEDFALVRAPDGKSGWIKRVYLATEAPAVIQLTDVTNERDALAEQVKSLNARLSNPAADPPSPPANDEAFENLVAENTDLKGRVASLRMEVSELKKSNADQKLAVDSQSDLRGENARLKSEQQSLEQALNEARAQLEQLAATHGDGGVTVAALTPLSASGSNYQNKPPWYWITGIGLGLFLIGGLGGIYLTDYLNRRRHGGFRV